MTLRLTAISMGLWLLAGSASAGFLGCKEDVEIVGPEQQATVMFAEQSMLPGADGAPVAADEELSFAPSVFNTVKRHMGIKAPVHNNVASENATLAVRSGPLGPADSRLAGFARMFGRQVSELAEAVVSAGQVTLGKLAPVVGFDLNRSTQKAVGMNLVADIGLRQQGREASISFARNNPTLQSKLDHEREQERINQMATAPGASFKWTPSASLGLAYRFE